jgi:hypothetical protein
VKSYVGLDGFLGREGAFGRPPGVAVFCSVCFFTAAKRVIGRLLPAGLQGRGRVAGGRVPVP